MPGGKKKSEKVLIPVANEIVNIFDELSKRGNINRDTLIQDVLTQFAVIYNMLQDNKILKPEGFINNYLSLIILAKIGFKFTNPNYSKTTDYKVLGEAIANMIKPIINDNANLDLVELAKNFVEYLDGDVKIISTSVEGNKVTLIVSRSSINNSNGSDSLEVSKELISGFLESLGYKQVNAYISSQILRLEFSK